MMIADRGRNERAERLTAGPERVIDLALPCHPRAPSMARKALREKRATLGPRLDLLELLVTETITNAVLHSGGDAESTVHLILSLDNGTLRTVVEDRGPGFKPQILENDVWSTSRRGLMFLDELADRWGTANDGVHSVWFELELNV